jgi:hypothetical protein
MAGEEKIFLIFLLCEKLFPWHLPEILMEFNEINYLGHLPTSAYALQRCQDSLPRPPSERYKAAEKRGTSYEERTR